jgi:CRP/FNR family cyclic AMP-dependent transcriptional regulator
MAQMFPMAMHAENCLLCKARKPGWFCDLPPLALAEYDAMGTHVMLPTGSRLFTEGQAARGVSVLCVGQVKLTKSSRDGKTLLVRIAKPGDVLGLSAALSKTPYEVTAEALEDTQIKTFRREDFLHFLEHHVEGSLHAAESINHEYRAALRDACRLALSSSIAGRMAHLLLELASESGTAQDAQPKIHMSLRHEDLASMLGSSRESVTRVLNDLKRKSIISIHGNKTTLLRKNALEALI